MIRNLFSEAVLLAFSGRFAKGSEVELELYHRGMPSPSELRAYEPRKSYNNRLCAENYRHPAASYVRQG
jgi:hypothetical protein